MRTSSCVALRLVAVWLLPFGLAAAHDAHRLTGAAKARPHREISTQTDRFAVEAELSPAPGARKPGRFDLVAQLSATSVCYNDTIFRDDFDGDGL